MTQRVLVVLDDADLSRVLRESLSLDGCQVECVTDADLATAAAETFTPDLVVLDLSLSGQGSVELCAELRRDRRRRLVLLIARGEQSQKLRGLNLGADDYVTKPLDHEELLACIRDVLRRPQHRVERISLGDVVVDFQTRHAWKGTCRIELTYREFELLHYLAERHDSVVRRDELLRAVWGYVELPHTRSVDHAIGRLRKKIERDPHHPDFVHTVQGDGYLLTTGKVSRNPSR